MIRQMQEEIEKLKKMLEEKMNSAMNVVSAVSAFASVAKQPSFSIVNG